MTIITLDALLARAGQVDLTLWIKDGYAQANTREPGSDGWSCHTAADPATALREALEARLRFARQAPDPEIDDLI